MGNSEAKTVKFLIFYSDLTSDSKKNFLNFMEINTPEEGNYDNDLTSISVLERSVNE